MRGAYTDSEEYLYKMLAEYLNMQYPDAIYHFDFGSGARLTKRASVTQSLLNGRGFPDLVIYEPKGTCHGLALELKREKTRIYKKDGSPATPHIGEQMKFLDQLNRKGYCATFGVGFDQTKRIIDKYMKGESE